LLFLAIGEGSVVAFSSDPSDPFSIFPLSILFPSKVSHVDPFAVLLAVKPIPFVGAPIRPDKFSVALLLVLNILSDILASIGPGESAPAMHFVIAPLSLVFPAVAPCVYSCPMDVVIEKLSYIH
jgi:hypothetical protein